MRCPLKKSYFNFSNFKISLFFISKLSIEFNRVRYSALIWSFNWPTSFFESTISFASLSRLIILSVIFFISWILFLIDFAYTRETTIENKKEIRRENGKNLKLRFCIFLHISSRYKLQIDFFSIVRWNFSLFYY